MITHFYSLHRAKNYRNTRCSSTTAAPSILTRTLSKHNTLGHWNHWEWKKENLSGSSTIWSVIGSRLNVRDICRLSPVYFVPVVNSLMSSAFRPIRYSKSTKLSPFRRVGASSCTLLLARQATPSPAAWSMGRSFAPSPTARVWEIGIEFSAARERRRDLFWAASMIGYEETRLPVRVCVVWSISSYR